MIISKRKVRILQAEKGLTTAALAAIAKFDPNRLSHIICAKIDIQPPTAGRLAAALGVPVVDILRDGDDDDA